MKYLFLISMFYSQSALAAYAGGVEVSVSGGFHFGSWIQTAETMVLRMEPNGLVNCTGGIPPKGGAGTINSAPLVTARNVLDESVWFRLDQETLPGNDFDGCRIDVTRKWIDANGHSGFMAPNETATARYGVELTVKGFCKAGSLNETIDFYSYYTNQNLGDSPDYWNMYFIPVSITFEDYITIEKTADLDFGQIVSSSAAGTVTVAPSGLRSGTNVILAQQKANAGKFLISGAGGRAIYLTLPQQVAIYSSSMTEMLVNNFVSDKGETFVLPPAASGAVASDTIAVGATLEVPANAVTGSYSGTYTITVSY